MKRIIKNKFITCLIAAVIALLVAVFALPSIIVSQKAYGYKTADMPSGSDAIGNIFKDNGKFDKDNLDLLAQKVDYEDIDDLVDNVSKVATTATTGVKTSADFGYTVVKFGKYNGIELTWIPVFVSNSSQGPILTLWLASSLSSNSSATSNQEVSKWTDGTVSNAAAAVDPSSNNYSTSYIRVVTLNNGGNYYGNYGGGASTKAPTMYQYEATSDGSNKFEAFTTGELAQYIVAPSNVYWQANENKTKNDPKWTTTSGNYTPTGWLNDKLWLPGICEVYTNKMSDNYTGVSFAASGGLWETGSMTDLLKRSNNVSTWLRSASAESRAGSYCLNATDKSLTSKTDGPTLGVRPALHLNLTKAIENSESSHVHTFAPGWTYDETNHWHAATCKHTKETDGLAEHDWDTGTVTTVSTCQKEGVKTYTCLTCGKTKTESVSKSDHKYATDWIYNAASHWHVCKDCGAVEPNSIAPHSGGTANCQQKATCSVCGQIYGDYGGHVLEHHEAKSPNCTEIGWNEYDTCKLCDYTTYAEIKATGHNYEAVEGGTPPTCTTAGKGKVRCSRCGDEKVGDSIPATGHNPGAEATCTTPQICTVCEAQLVAALGHNFGDWVVTKEATFVEDGLKRRDCSRCDEFETEVIPAKGVSECGLTLDLATNFAYGDEIAPVISAKYGEIAVKWYDTTTGEELAEKPSTVGSYKLVASVAENLDEGYYGAEKEVEFTISKREITVTIHAGSSVAGDDLEELSATVTSGSIVGEIPYTLSTNADKETMGEYTITGTCTNDNYQITFVDGVYIVSKKLEDDNGEIDLPVDIDVVFKVTQSQTASDYSELKGLKTGYWAQLWYRNEDGTLGDEFTDTMNCILTLKIPTDIIEGIRGGEEINRDKIAAGLKVYYVNGDGEYISVDNFKIAQKEDESWIVKFNYNEKFRAEVIFNAENVFEPTPEPASGLPWWVWLIVVMSIIVAIILIIVIAIAAKNKKNGGGTPVMVDDDDLKAQLDEQGQKLDELLGRDDGGFNTPVELDENGNVIFK